MSNQSHLYDQYGLRTSRSQHIRDIFVGTSLESCASSRGSAPSGDFGIKAKLRELLTLSRYQSTVWTSLLDSRWRLTGSTITC